MPRHKKGTLVRIRTEDEVGEYLWEKNSTGKEVRHGGWLYTIVRYLPIEHRDNEHRHPAYECKSIATGGLAQLFPEEITTCPSKETNNVSG